MRAMTLLTVGAMLAAAHPALAQTASGPAPAPDALPAGPPSLADTVFDGDHYVTIGLGAGVTPRYEGADDYRIRPLPALQGRVAGFDFAARGPGIAVDLLREADGARTNLIFGPYARARFDRNNGIGDPVVRALGKRDIAVEVGASAGIGFRRLISPVDTLTIQTDVLFDVAGAHEGRLISPSITYSTPLSYASFASLSLSADHADGDYMRTYFSVDPAGSAASGLPVFAARGGWKSTGLTLLTAYDLSGDGRDGGWGLFLLASRSWLLNDAKTSPITRLRGDNDQWFGVAGVSYTF